MNSKTWSRATLCAVAATMLTAGGAFADEERANAVLDRMGEYYETIDALTYDIRMYSLQKMGPQEQENDLRVQVSLERPNKFSLDIRDATQQEEPSVRLRSDGEQLLAYQVEQNRYSTQEAPEEFADLLQSQMLLQLTQGTIELALSPMTDDPVGELLEQATEVSYAGEEEFEGEPHDVIRLDTQQQVGFDLYVTQGDEPRLHQVEVDFSEAIAQAQQFGQEIEAEAYFRFNNWEVQDSIADETFAFTPPEDAEEVASLIEQPEQEAHALTGEEAEDFNLERMAGGERTLSEHEGENIVILDFWATWCGPCVRAMPMIIEVAEEYEDRNVVFYAVNLRETEEEIEAFLEEHGMEIDNVLLDREGAVAQAYQARSIPQTVIVGKDGVVESVHVGFTPDLKERLSAELDEMLAE